MLYDANTRTFAGDRLLFPLLDMSLVMSSSSRSKWPLGSTPGSPFPCDLPDIYFSVSIELSKVTLPSFHFLLWTYSYAWLCFLLKSDSCVRPYSYCLTEFMFFYFLLQWVFLARRADFFFLWVLLLISHQSTNLSCTRFSIFMLVGWVGCHVWFYVTRTQVKEKFVKLCQDWRNHHRQAKPFLSRMF